MSTTVRYVVFALHGEQVSPSSTMHDTREEAETAARWWMKSIKGLSLYVVAVTIDSTQGQAVGPDANGFELEG
jgi:hypothetical protein